LLITAHPFSSTAASSTSSPLCHNPSRPLIFPTGIPEGPNLWPSTTSTSVKHAESRHFPTEHAIAHLEHRLAGYYKSGSISRKSCFHNRVCTRSIWFLAWR
jgi:hypothetical protein